MLNEYKERKLAEFQKEVDELRSDYDFNKCGDTVIHKFGYKTKCEKEEPETPEIFVITDFGNIKQFISDLIDEVEQKIPKPYIAKELGYYNRG
jgi:translation elongation factor EF-Tu-like GTPase